MEDMQEMQTRREVRSIVGRSRGGKLMPVNVVPVIGGESGMLSQSVMVELDPIAGRLLNPVTVEMTAVFVPLQAMEHTRWPSDDTKSVTELIRRRLDSGEDLYPLEAPNEVTDRLRIHPRMVAGVPKVSSSVRIAHNAAVNFLRKRRYTYAAQRLPGDITISPAILSQTVLDRMNAVLDPEERVNGFVPFDLPTLTLPVEGIGVREAAGAIAPGYNPASGSVVETGGDFASPETKVTTSSSGSDANPVMALTAAGVPDVNVVFGGQTSGISLTDMYNAETQDKLVRYFRRVIDANPIDGEEQILRWCYGLSMDTARNPWVIAERTISLGMDYSEATDGVSLLNDVARSKLMGNISFSAPVPKTELGGMIVTFLSVKPDEVLEGQPHPILTEGVSMPNRAADMLKIDPVPVTMREIDTSVPSGSETSIAFYTGYNELKRLYVDYGFSLHLDPADIENRSALWQLKIPPSVTPSNILYPADLDHYPFADNLAEVARYQINSSFAAKTPLVFGPTPLEAVDVVTDENLFEEE
ncbi:MAG: hypothetical protein [Microviridae sp.]|nr:MAG: hypothetical protein [Microviridae sp.]